MLHPLTWLALFAAISAHTCAAICYKKATTESGRKAIGIFVLGNVVGFLNPVFKTMALRNNNPNVIFAIMTGLGGIFFILVINWVFRGQLSRFQWFAIVIIIFGSVVLQIQPSVSE